MDTLLQIPQELLIGSIAILDRLPDAIRAMLSGLLLVQFLKFFEARIKGNEVQFGQSFRKTALVALIFIPLLVWLFPASRMVVFVEDLPPRASPDSWAWLMLISCWSIGWLLSLSALVRSHYRSSRAAARSSLLNDEKLDARLAHWQRRLGMQQRLQLVAYPGDQPRLFTQRGRIGIPAAAQHWPGNTQDILLINNLCHRKKHHGRWHLIAQLVASVYWPVTWIQTLHQNLLQDFQRAAAELTESCYQDKMGYGRALRQLDQRLAAPVAGDRRNYRDTLLQLFTPQAEPIWDIGSMLADSGADNSLLWTDPYDRVVLFIGQAVFLAFLLTGVTLKEKPPEFDDRYSIPFELLWKEHFHRNQELMDKMDGAG